MATFFLDDTEVSFEPGDTVIRAAARAGIDIPHYCWHPGLSVAGNCRMCLVELVPPRGRSPLTLDVLYWDAEKQQYFKEQKPKLVPACNHQVSEGIRVLSQSSEHVTRARAAVQEMLLLNHPVDCPICDQAGECFLQDYWLSHGPNKKRMLDEVVHKPKAVVFGPHIVYDAERCVICTRCVRFCNEVAKDPVLSVSQRTNLDEIIVSPGRQLDHNYSLMTEFVCPVGALTATEFRFKARVWFLRSVRSVCVGCATGCNSFIDYDPRDSKVYRYRPRENPDVNQHWMCDVGMLDYQRISENRVSEPRVRGEIVSRRQARDRAADVLRGVVGAHLAVVLGAEFSLEDNAAMLAFGRKLGCTYFFESGRPDGNADRILMVADRNPNSNGIRELLASEPRSPDELVSSSESGRIRLILALGAQLKSVEQSAKLVSSQVPRIVLTSHEGALTQGADVVLPLCAWAETEGTFVNAKGMAQLGEQAILPLGRALPGWKWVAHLAKALEHELSLNSISEVRSLVPATLGAPNEPTAVTKGT